jgi:DNA-binding response OmpR family regulator
MRILIIDPDARFAKKAAKYLESKAHLVVNLPSADNALRHAHQWTPDLVILAAEYAEETNLLEALGSLPKRVAVVLSEHMDRYDRAWRAWQRGGDELLMKPVFHARELQEAITAAMENAAATGRQQTVAASA